MNLFDGIAKSIFNVANTAFGNHETKWVPSNGGAEITAKVLFSFPTGKTDMGVTEYHVDHPQVEFFEGDFPGLIALVEAREDEKFTVEVAPAVFKNYRVDSIKRKYDGNTVVAYLTPLD